MESSLSFALSSPKPGLAPVVVVTSDSTFRCCSFSEAVSDEPSAVGCSCWDHYRLVSRDWRDRLEDRPVILAVVVFHCCWLVVLLSWFNGPDSGFIAVDISPHIEVP